MHILLLDGDIESSRRLVRYFQDASFEIILAASLSQAREAMSRQSFDVLVLDARLPDGSGLPLCSEIRERQGDSLVIILLTDDPAPAHRVIGLELGADDVVAKPCAPNELIARIEARIRRRLATVSTIGQPTGHL
jgi:DNA-binding response OmpR family regulator